MAKAREIFTYDDARYAPLRDAARNATRAYQDAARGLDTLKEWVLIEFGLMNLSNAIHALAHEQPKRFDAIGDILHQRHLMQEYPATEEYRARPANLDDVFEEIIRMLDRIETALKECVRVSDEQGLYPLGRAFENLQMQNSESYETFLYAWEMFDATDGSATSYDNWVRTLFENEGK